MKFYKLTSLVQLKVSAHNRDRQCDLNETILLKHLSETVRVYQGIGRPSWLIKCPDVSFLVDFSICIQVLVWFLERSSWWRTDLLENCSGTLLFRYGSLFHPNGYCNCITKISYNPSDIMVSIVQNWIQMRSHPGWIGNGVIRGSSWCNLFTKKLTAALDIP